MIQLLKMKYQIKKLFKTSINMMRAKVVKTNAIEATDRIHLDLLQIKVFNSCFHLNPILIGRTHCTQLKKRAIKNKSKIKMQNIENCNLRTILIQGAF